MVEMHLETKRNLFHLLVGLAIVALLHFDIIDVWIILAVVLVGSLVSIVSRKARLPIIHWFLQRFDREADMSSIPGRGALFLFVSFLLVVALFQKDIAMASITIFVIGDSVSPLVGARFGRVRHPLSDKKFIEGSIAGLMAAFVVATLFVSPLEALLASICAMTVEAVDTIRGKRIEDNITIPLVAGLVITAIRAIF